MHRTLLSKTIAFSAFVLSASIALPLAASQTVSETAKQAIEYNPEVQDTWYRFQGSEYDLDSARAGYRPTIDLNANYGREIRSGSGWSAGTKSPFNGGRAEVSLVQMLYDGFQTSGSVASAEQSRIANYFQLVQQTQNTALDAYAAHLDVVRGRQLVELAEQNLKEHRKVFRQIQMSSNAGVGNNADLDQITGRLSLAHANLITSRSDLNAIESRYMRVVGAMPPAELSTPQESPVPYTAGQAFARALRDNPQFLSSLYRIKASEADVDASKSGYHPRVNLTARYGSQDYDDRGLDNSRTDGRIAIELHYNLYNGGRDKAAIKSAYNRVNQSKAQRDSACTSVRQNLQVAYQDTVTYKDQIPVLEQHKQASNRVRQAYKDQFLIGRRSLLDVLDAENEYFQASRALVQAELDYALATARTQNAMGTLLQTLGIMRDDLPSLSELGADAIAVDPNTACPTSEIVLTRAD
ncbi:TolC family outer membrane protein [Marinobacter daepoensis]|uniref:TolC family outer membrane protein n=1 Tax=Marinobacter daepoensis TaxID=262077 RepID=A0ABS3BDU5_9GAMM|nr:TolC family outer membrane protein [Marinobacter daepoensis]MBN7769672.1 TolC family outer membrane protein [Marinobacter daepoensis]MBY6078362.1 TolC family outer membrane protein [Marinobacter daepoensis]